MPPAESGKFKQVFVSGADGFIGSHLVERLLGRGYAVTALVWYNAFGHNGWLDQATRPDGCNLSIIKGDIRDPFALRDSVAGCDAVLHLASLIGIPYSYEAPASYLQTNVTGTLNILEASRSAGVQRFVHVSTSEVYGSAQQLPMTENHPLSAQSPYAATKIASDQLVLSYVRSFDFPAVVVRPFNTYGPRQSRRAIVPTIITQLLKQPDRLTLGSLEPRRDLTFVTDTADGIIASLEHDEITGEVVHLGSGTDISIADLAAKIASFMNREIDIVCDPRRIRPTASEVDHLLADVTKAERLFDWRPAVGLDDGLLKTVDWFRSDRALNLYAGDEYAV